MFFVNDKEPQVGQYDVLTDQAMGADDDIHRTAGQPFDNGFLLFLGEDRESIRT